MVQELVYLIYGLSFDHSEIRGKIATFYPRYRTTERGERYRTTVVEDYDLLHRGEGRT